MVEIERIKTYLFRELGVGEEEINELLELARQNLYENSIKLEEALLNGDLEKVAKIAHTIKGMVLNLGLEEEAALFKQLELKAKEGASTYELQAMVEKLKNRFINILR